MTDIDHVEIRPDKFGWELWIYGTASDPELQPKVIPLVFGIGDAIQFHAETERTIGRWLADGPADFHGSISVRNSWGPNWEPITTTDEED